MTSYCMFNSEENAWATMTFHPSFEAARRSVPDARVVPTAAQMARIALLVRSDGDMSDVLSRVVYAPFDLPPGWLMVEVRGVTYGISPEGEAHS